MTTQTENVRSEADAAAIAALAEPYAATAKEIGGKVKGLENMKGNIWRSVRGSVGIAHDAGHSVDSFTQGMAQALLDAEVAAGSIRSYMDTATKLLALVLDGKAEIGAVLKMDIHTARKAVPNKRAPRQPNGDKGNKDEGETIAVDSATAEALHANAKGTASDRQLWAALCRAWTKLSSEARAELVELAEAQTATGSDAEAAEADDAGDAVDEALAANG